MADQIYAKCGSARRMEREGRRIVRNVVCVRFDVQLTPAQCRTTAVSYYSISLCEEDHAERLASRSAGDNLRSPTRFVYFFES
jgi:hypothetical protein